MKRWLLLICLLFAALLAAGYFYTAQKSEEIAQRYPPEGMLVSVQGGRIHLTDQRPTGESVATVALIHGASGNEREMRAALGEALLRANYRVISIDRPGHGWSDRYDSQRDASPAQQALLIRRALEAIDARHVIAVGHSLAGALTLQLALDQTDIVRGAVMISAVSHPWPGGIALYYSISSLAIVGPAFNSTLTLPVGLMMMEPVLKGVFAPQSPPAHYRSQSGVDLVLRPQVFHLNALDVAALHGFVSAQQARYSMIKVPLAIVAGEKDIVVSASIHARALAAQVPGATLDVIANGGHAPHWTHRARVIAAIESVRKRLAGPR